MNIQEIKDLLNNRNRDIRLACLKKRSREIENYLTPIPLTEDVNNHIHTFYSFSPYSPSLGSLLLRECGLGGLGLMDHDSLAGAEELRRAAEVMGISSTVGCELRVNYTGTPVEGRKINNMHLRNSSYILVFGIPAGHTEKAHHYLLPVRRARLERNQKVVARLNTILREEGLEELSFEKEVLPLSLYEEGGTITERHILYALSLKLVKTFGKGTSLLVFLQDHFNLRPSGNEKTYLGDKDNPFYLYDLTAYLKQAFLSTFFIQPSVKECPSVIDMVDFFNSIGAIPAYAYVGDSPSSAATGSTEGPAGPSAQKYEDHMLDTLFPLIYEIGFKGVTYIPTRITKEQHFRVHNLCRKYNLMEISCQDINSPRHAFRCSKLLEPDFAHLLDSTWAIIANEKLTDYSPELGLFSSDNPLADTSLSRRIEVYSRIGKTLDPRHPTEISQQVQNYFTG